MPKPGPSSPSATLGWILLALLALCALWWLLPSFLPEWFESFPAPKGLDNATALVIDNVVGWMKREWVGFFDVFTFILRSILNVIEKATVSTPWPLTSALIVILAWRLSAARAAIFTGACLAY